MTPVGAQAGGVDVDLNIGVPGFYRYDDDYYYHDDYAPLYYSDRWDRPRYYAPRMSCREARSIVRSEGYRNVSARDCSGRTYSFSATRHGDRVRVYVNARTGALWRG
jgi:hypothetical protein